MMCYKPDKKKATELAKQLVAYFQTYNLNKSTIDSEVDEAILQSKIIEHLLNNDDEVQNYIILLKQKINDENATILEQGRFVRQLEEFSDEVSIYNRFYKK